MKIFTLGWCSITLGAVGAMALPAYFWSFIVCIVLGFLCQLAAFWQARKEDIDERWKKEIHQRYADGDSAERRAVVMEVLDRLGIDEGEGS